MRKIKSVLLVSSFIVAIHSSPALAEQKFWVLLWNTYFESSNSALINTSQTGRVFNTKEECHTELKKQAFWQKENNDNDYFKSLKIEFLSPDRLIARVSGPDIFSHLSCNHLSFAIE